MTLDKGFKQLWTNFQDITTKRTLELSTQQEQEQYGLQLFTQQMNKLWPDENDSFSDMIQKWHRLRSDQIVQSTTASSTFDHSQSNQSSPAPSSSSSWYRTWAFDHYNKVYCVANGISAWNIGNCFRKKVNLTNRGVVAINVLLPSLVGSVMFGTLFHLHQVLFPLVVRCNSKSDNVWRYILTSIGVHLSTSTLYPLMFTPASAIYFASRTHSFPIPEDLIKSPQSRRYLWEKVVLATLKQNRKRLTVLTLLNATIAALMTYEEWQQTSLVHRELMNQVMKQVHEQIYHHQPKLIN